MQQIKYFKGTSSPTFTEKIPIDNTSDRYTVEFDARSIGAVLSCAYFYMKCFD